MRSIFEHSPFLPPGLRFFCSHSLSLSWVPPDKLHSSRQRERESARTAKAGKERTREEGGRRQQVGQSSRPAQAEELLRSEYGTG